MNQQNQSSQQQTSLTKNTLFGPNTQPQQPQIPQQQQSLFSQYPPQQQQYNYSNQMNQNVILNSVPQFNPNNNNNFQNNAIFNQQQSLFGNNQIPQYIPQQNVNYNIPTLFGVNQAIQYDFTDDELIQPKKENVKQQEQYNLEQNLQFEIKTQYKLGKLLNEKTQYLPGIISIKTKDNPQQQRVGVDLICLIDKSGSMQGQKIQMVHSTLKLLLTYLNENDRLQLITFDDQAQRLTPLKRVSDENKQYFQNMIQSIYAGGGTTIGSATNIAFQQIQNRKYQNSVTSIFLLSDGQDGSAENSVKNQLQNNNQVFTIHSFGFGSDHDAKMMSALCNLRNGSFYFVQDIKLLDEFFIDALGGLISVVGEQLEININCQPQQPFQEIHIHKTYGKMWNQIQQQRQYKITLPQLASGIRKDFVFELGLPKFNQHIEDHQRNCKIIKGELKIKDPITGQIIIKQTELELTFLNSDELIKQNEEDIDVVTQYYRVKATDVIDDARRACEQNKNEEAEKMINQMIVSIQKNPKIAQQSQGIITDLNQAKQGSKREAYQQFGSKQMCQMVSNNYCQQGVTSLFSAQGAQVAQPSQGMYQNSCQYQLMNQVQQSKKPY